ncbi:DNA-directed RNA polymerase II subunit [Cyclospora cayetanensis]|uniref:DNA-directed RNA polymerase II subunit n=1 Tax=Cyclospora cayetanensis TaxID=88456 RepID=A0A1D3CRC0_9EIME|nr:DNA-directed RNA polymerase II subunit [Cyclospora cayetanensis]
MFFVIERWESVALRPAQLGPQYLASVEALLRQQVEGKCLQSVGYVVCVIRVLQNLPGRIQDSTGLVVVAAKYQAIVFKPFKEEVLDAVITDVNKLGLFAQCGPLKVFVSRASLPASYTFQEDDAMPSFSDGSLALRTGGEIRLKLLGVRFEASQIFAVATTNADYLGPLEPRDAVAP